MSTAHVVVGAAVGAAVGNPVGGLLLGILSHHLLDLIPHWDVGSFYAPTFDPPKLTRRDVLIAAVDGLVAVGLLWFMAVTFGGSQVWALVAGGVGGLLPDIWHHIPWWKSRSRQITKRWFSLHERWHWTVAQSQMGWGLLTQVVAIGLAWWWLASVR